MKKNEIRLRNVLTDVENQMWENNFEGFKAVVRSLAKDTRMALDKAEALWEIESDSKELREKFHLVRHYLDYLKRFCKGMV